MLYMVEMELPDRSRVADWHDWYVAHIHKLLTIDGYHASQRFEAITPRAAPFLAVHDVVGPELFESSGYRTTGGPVSTGEWQTAMTNWSRNLYDGCEAMPEVVMDQILVIADDAEKLPAAYNGRVTWLTSIALDKNIPRRGFFILQPDEDVAVLRDASVDLFKPITAKLC